MQDEVDKKKKIKDFLEKPSLGDKIKNTWVINSVEWNEKGESRITIGM